MISGTRHARSRRRALRLVVAIAVVAVCRAPIGTRAAEEDEKSVAVRPEASAGLDDLKTIKERILAPLLAPVDVGAVQRLIDTLQADGSWPSIDYQEKRRSAWTPVGHLGNVLLLARGYRSPGSKLTGSTELRDARDAALDYWLEHDFQNSNWWWNQIGVPRSLAPVLLLMEDELSETQRGKGLEILRRARIGMTGQNLVWVTEITALRGILEQDPKLVASAYRRIAEEIRVDVKEGIQPDFSFHQHGPCLYSHGYGSGFAVDCSRIAKQVAGTSLAFPPEKITLLSSLLLDGSQWLTRGGTSDFGAEGREISRKGQDAGYLATAAQNMLALPTGREDEFRALAARASGGSAPPLVGNRHFWRSDVMTHHRPGYYTSARMFSSRIANTDDPCNSEGLESHHIADGCNVVLRTGREYGDVFPVWDWQKIPGTTVEQKEQLTGSPRTMGKSSFVGGVSDGVHGLAACDLVRGALSARKSWFFFDREYVCLGARITCGSENTVVTTLNQCNLRGSVLARDGSQVRQLDPGVHSLESPAWVWHDSVAYVFLGPARVGLGNELQQGNWWRINHRYAKDEVSREVFSLWIEHGSAPKGASYAYVVVPGVKRDFLETYATKPPLEIVANRAGLQAVWHEDLGILGAAFYEPGRSEIRPALTVAVDEPCLVLLRERPEGLVVSVSNAENKQASVTMELSGRWGEEDVEVAENQEWSRVTFELPGGRDAGRSVTKRLTRRRPVTRVEGLSGVAKCLHGATGGFRVRGSGFRTLHKTVRMESRNSVVGTPNRDRADISRVDLEAYW